MYPFELLDEESVRKNFIPFIYGKDGNKVFFIARPNFFQIILARPKRWRISTSQVCNEVRILVEYTLGNITENTDTVLNTYNLKSVSRRYQLAFDCPIHHEEDHLCMVKKGDYDPSIMWCINSKGLKTRVEMAEEHKVWFGEVKNH